MVTAAQGAAATVCARVRLTEWWTESRWRNLPCAARGDARPPDNSAHGGRPSPAAASLIYRMDPDKVEKFRAGSA